MIEAGTVLLRSFICICSLSDRHDLKISSFSLLGYILFSADYLYEIGGLYILTHHYFSRFHATNHNADVPNPEQIFFLF